MSLTQKQAYDEICDPIRLVGIAEDFAVHWDNKRTNNSKTEENSYVAFLVRTAGSGPPTLGGVGHRSFGRFGTAIARVFTPTGKGLSEGYALAKSISDVYEGVSTPNGVWFRNVRTQEIGKEGSFFEMQVLIEFQYDEIK